MATNCKYAPTTFRPHTAGGAITSGDGVYDTTADILGVAMTNASGSGVVISIALDGVWTLPATAAEVWAKGEPLYWDPATSKLTNIAGGLTKVGTCFTDKAAVTGLTGDVDLQIGV